MFVFFTHRMQCNDVSEIYIVDDLCIVAFELLEWLNHCVVRGRWSVKRRSMLNFCNCFFRDLRLKDLKGSIATTIGKLTAMIYLFVLFPSLSFFSHSAKNRRYLHINGLTGTIPTQIGQLSLLQFLCVDFFETRQKNSTHPLTDI